MVIETRKYDMKQLNELIIIFCLCVVSCTSETLTSIIPIVQNGKLKPREVPFFAHCSSGIEPKSLDSVVGSSN